MGTFTYALIEHSEGIKCIAERPSHVEVPFPSSKLLVYGRTVCGAGDFSHNTLLCSLLPPVALWTLGLAQILNSAETAEERKLRILDKANKLKNAREGAR